jgi:hypothetical protein
MTVIQKGVSAEIESQNPSRDCPWRLSLHHFDESQDPHFQEDREAPASHFQPQGDRPDLGLLRSARQSIKIMRRISGRE